MNYKSVGEIKIAVLRKRCAELQDQWTSGHPSDELRAKLDRANKALDAELERIADQLDWSKASTED